jgi:anti-anti-sigma regulatory factor
MATKDNNNSGLLSKVAKFVRNPDHQLDRPRQAGSGTRQRLQQAGAQGNDRAQAAERLRPPREFDQLRKLRNRDPSAGNPDLAGRPSYFQSSLPSNPGERASTIKKIDEIEAQMSNQWWQGKSDGAKPPGAGTVAPAQDAAAPAKPAAPPPRAEAQISDIGYAATKLAPMVPEASAPAHGDFMATQTSSSFARAAPSDPAPRVAPPARSPDRSGFAQSQSFAIEAVEVVTDSDLEESAIRFANGDDAGAETALLDALRSPDARREQIDTWSAALFDLYRATGQQARFDSVAIDFAERFGRSAPAWFSMPELLGIKASGTIVRTIPSRLEDEPIWRSPTHFTQSGVDDLQLALANAPTPWFIDWGATESLEANAIVPLAAVVSQWAASPVQLRFRNAHNLERVLRAATPAGNKSVNQTAWQLRMDMLRILGLQDDFELVALEYCVTYEVSPPAWQDVRCSYVDESAQSEPPELDGSGPDSQIDPAAEAPDSQGLTMPMGYDSAPAAVVELTGEIQGEATEALARLEGARQGGDRLVVSCANLIRVDFSAAGSILNWVATRQSEGCHVQFREVHRLVAAFFHVIGIHEHARVVLRSH